MRRFLIAGAVAVSLGGCAELQATLGGAEFFEKAANAAGKVDDVTTGNFAKGIALYCAKVPTAARSKIRDHLNARSEMKGAKAAVWCVDEAPVTLGP